MDLRAILDDDGTASVSFGEPGSMAGFEVDWHTAELTLKSADGALVRSVTRTVGGQTVVGGPDPAPAASGTATANGTASAEVTVQHEPTPSATNPAGTDAHADSVPGADMASQGFASFSQHADEVKP